MTSFSLPDNFTTDLEALLRKNRSHTTSSATPPTNEPVTPTPSATIAVDQKSLREFSIPAVANVPSGPAVNICDKNFKLCTRLIMVVQASPFCGLPSEDVNAHP
jgi:hypothetical protein